MALVCPKMEVLMLLNPVPVILFLSLIPAPSLGSFNLANARTTYDIFGAPRADTKFLPGDKIVLSFDIEGIQPDVSGKVRYSIAMEVTDGKGVVQFKQAPRDKEGTLALGGSRLPAFASIQIGTDQPAGDYTVKLTVTDVVSKASNTLTKTYQVLPKAFGLVRVTTTGDPNAQVPLPFPSEGQSLWVNFVAVGFGRDQGKGQPNLSVTLNVLDESGKPTLAKPFTGEVNQNVPAQAQALPLQFLLDLNQAGKFTVAITATDNISGKTANLSLPLVVSKSK
jgi:hypothetical protein